MKLETINNFLNIILVSIIVFFVAFSISWYYENVHIYAVSSVLSGCHIQSSNNDISYVAGTTHVEYNQDFLSKSFMEPNITITVDSLNILSDKEKLIVYIHELCHRDQVLKGEISNCNSKLGRLIRYENEVICYIKQNFPRSDLNKTEILQRQSSRS